MKGKRLKVKGERWLTRCIICVALPLTFHLSPFTSCSRDSVCNTPFGAGGVIDITMPDFASLQTIGGYLTVNRGYKGIFVRRISYSEFVAFECACPHCHEERLRPLAGWDGTVLQCPRDSSLFETLYGQPIEGSATPCPLYEYNTHFDGLNLEIY